MAPKPMPNADADTNLESDANVDVDVDAMVTRKKWTRGRQRPSTYLTISMKVLPPGPGYVTTLLLNNLLTRTSSALLA